MPQLPVSTSSENLSLQRLDGVTVLLPHVLLDVISEHDDGIVVLLHATLGALDARLKPGHDALGVKDVFALELLCVVLTSPDAVKTNGTCL